MSFLKSFAAFWYDFVVGDDWTIAVGVVALLAVCALLARLGDLTASWVLLPLGVMALLAFSLWRAVRAD